MARRTSVSYLDPGEKHGEGDDVVELHLPVGDEFEVGEAVLILEQFIENFAHFHLSVQVEDHAEVRDKNDQDIEHVPDGLEVLKSVMTDLGRRFDRCRTCEYLVCDLLRALLRRCSRP